MEGLKIWALAIVAAVLYGICHDQITTRVCVEYFTIGHPRLIDSDSPTVLAFFWGFVATWWVGAALGIFLAAASRIGPWPKLRMSDLVTPIAILLLVMAMGSLVAGIVGFQRAATGEESLTGYLAIAIPAPRQARFIADWWAHSAAYAIGFFGGLALCAWSLLARVRRAHAAPK